MALTYAAVFKLFYHQVSVLERAEPVDHCGSSIGTLCGHLCSAKTAVEQAYQRPERRPGYWTVDSL